MPNYIFLTHTPQNIDANTRGWNPVGLNNVEDIEDDILLLNAHKMSSSIPTPLARILTFKNAFKIITKQLENIDFTGLDDVAIKNDVRGKKIEESVNASLVSDCLDFIELLFKDGLTNIKQFHVNPFIADSEKYKDYFGEKEEQIALAEAFNQTIKSHFDGSLDITLLKYKDTLIGGTSPFTLFYTSPNWRKEMHNVFGETCGLNGEDKFFDNEYCLLHNREPKFIKFLHDIVNEYASDENSLLFDFAKYVKKSVSIRAGGDNLINSFLELSTVQYEKDTTAEFSINTNLGNSIKIPKIKNYVSTLSDFILDVDYNNPNIQNLFGANPALVLNKNRNIRLTGIYTNYRNTWDPNFLTDGLLDENFTNRKRPGLNDTHHYPFITESDIFQDNIIDVSFAIDNDNFLTLLENVNVIDNRTDFKNTYRELCYLLPFKPLLFKLYGIEEIKKAFRNNENTGLKIRIERGTTIRVSVSIPIKSNHTREPKGSRTIEFCKEYNLETKEVKQNSPFDLVFFPFFRVTNPNFITINDGIRRNVMLIRRTKGDVAHQVKEINFLDNDFKKIDDINYKERFHYETEQVNGQDVKIEISTGYYITNLDFYAIEVKLNNASSGIIIPKLREINSTLVEKHWYAVDFGTTNTHIEYGKVENNQVKTPKKDYVFELNYDNNSNLVRSLKKDNKYPGELDKALPIQHLEYLPFEIGNNKQFGFPTRTMVVDFYAPKNNSEPFSNSNFTFYNENKNPNVISSTDLKWHLEKDSTDDITKNRIRIFYEEILMLIKYHSISNNVNPTSVKIGFTFPQAMINEGSNSIFSTLRDLILLANRVTGFNDNNFLFNITESIAPLNYYKGQDLGDAAMCCIDIGGGSTDITITSQGDLERGIISSIRFAGNNLWGCTNKEDRNGFIKYYNLKIENGKLYNEDESDDFSKIYGIYLFLLNKGTRDEDLISFLFKHPILEFKNKVFDSCKDFKLVLLIHYCSILYYINVLVNENKNEVNYPLPLYFSGNGSRYLEIIFTKDLKISLSQFADYIIKKFNSNKASTINSRINDFSKAKQLTAKGALYNMHEYINDDIQNDNQPLVDGNINPLEVIRDNNGVIAHNFNPKKSHIIQGVDFKDIFKSQLTLKNELKKYFKILEQEIIPVEAALGLKNTSDCFKIIDEEFINKCVINWWNDEKKYITKDTDSLFLKPIKYILSELSIEIFKKNQPKPNV
ncbi:MAG: hypothetical protein U0T69_10850 [Chitinophagales bacterium]